MLNKIDLNKVENLTPHIINVMVGEEIYAIRFAEDCPEGKKGQIKAVVRLVRP